MERELGPQPIAAVMTQHDLNATDLVEASEESLTYKMVNKACRGRRLTPSIQAKVTRALSRAAKKPYEVRELFTY